MEHLQTNTITSTTSRASLADRSAAHSTPRSHLTGGSKEGARGDSGGACEPPGATYDAGNIGARGAHLTAQQDDGGGSRCAPFAALFRADRLRYTAPVLLNYLTFNLGVRFSNPISTQVLSSSLRCRSHAYVCARAGFPAMPYLSLHMRALGVSADELGLLSLCSRALSIPLRPGVALLADKHSRHTLVRSRPRRRRRLRTTFGWLSHSRICAYRLSLFLCCSRLPRWSLWRSCRSDRWRRFRVQQPHRK